jgi:hypothetical protein
MWARKNKIRPISGFFTKMAYIQVMNFIPVKVSTLYMSAVDTFHSKSSFTVENKINYDYILSGFYLLCFKIKQIETFHDV